MNKPDLVKLRETFEYFGISLSVMAEELGISRQLLHLKLKGERSLVNNESQLIKAYVLRMATELQELAKTL